MVDGWELMVDGWLMASGFLRMAVGEWIMANRGSLLNNFSWYLEYHTLNFDSKILNPEPCIWHIES